MPEQFRSAIVPRGQPAIFRELAATLEAGQEAELGPDDAIFIPKDWFHHVESLERFNMLANYWWDGSARERPEGAAPG
jgi:hypothetical protein